MTKMYSGNPGFFCVIEGIDGSGKSTVIQQLGKMEFPLYGEGITPTLTRQPGGSEFSEKLRHTCLNENVSKEVQTLFYSALIIDGLQKTVIPAVKNKELVISDRGFGTTFCYQGLALGNEDMVYDILRTAEKVIVPDLTIYLSIPLAKSIERAQPAIGRSEDRYSKMEMFDKECIKETYDLFYGCPTETNHLSIPSLTDGQSMLINALSMTTKSSVVINADDSLENVVANCHAAIMKHFTRRYG